MAQQDGGGKSAGAPYIDSNRGEAIEAGFQPDEWRGVFVMQGQRISISEFTISINEQGEIQSPGPTLSTSIEMAPYWLLCAIEHAERAEKLSKVTDAAWTTASPEHQVHAVESEFRSSLQAITAAAFAMDSFYASLIDVAPTPSATRKAWRKNGTRRSRQVFETIRRNFPMGPKSKAFVRGFLDELFSFRDQGVHPTSRTRQAVKHPRLPVSMDEVFCKFRARNARISVGQVVQLLEAFVAYDKTKSSAVSERMALLKVQIEPLVAKWRKTRAGKRDQKERSLKDTTPTD